MINRKLRSIIATMAAGSACLVAPGVPAGAAVTADRGAAPTFPGWASVDAGYEHTCGVAIDHTLWCWGRNKYGALGNGHHFGRSRPTEVGEDADWQVVSAGGDDTCAVRVDGTLWCWGRNYEGQLGLGDKKRRFVPAQVGTDHWTSVSTGMYHTCAVRADGTLWCWGQNTYGQLGNGTTQSHKRPVRIGPSSDWLSVSAGWSHTCGIRASHVLRCWGDNGAGQLGVGDEQPRLVPTPVGKDRDWSTVSAEASGDTCGVKFDETAWCWGSNNFGQLGDGTTTAHDVPTQIGDGTTWTTVTVGFIHACGVQSPGALYCWGDDREGQLGDGGFDTYRTSPVRVGNGAAWRVVSPGGYHTCGVHADLTAWCWGLNAHGQLGDGGSLNRSVPTLVLAK